ncbi:MAG: hypothetical protein WCT01_00410 [Candidatus Shapirobacteria bacterium]
MIKEEKGCEDCCQKVIYKTHNYSGGSGAIYGLGMIGALFYFLQNASGLASVLIGIGKSVFWPAILMFRLLTELRM